MYSILVNIIAYNTAFQIHTEILTEMLTPFCYLFLFLGFRGYFESVLDKVTAVYSVSVTALTHL